MSKPDTASGLLSKMVKFVRNPASSWSQPVNTEANVEEALSKQLLKEMIERKRRNDFVRKRELDMLRKMRKRDAMGGQELSAEPSFFHSSLPSTLADRASTIKKIDEIEAQMSMQWWKTKHGAASINSSSGPASAGGNPAMSQPPLGTTPHTSQALSDPAEKNASTELPGSGNMLAFTLPSGAQTHSPMVFNAPVKVSMIGGLSGVGVSDENSPSGFTPSRMVAMDVFEVAHDAELEEASICFANGDDAGAEAGFIEMLSPKGSRVGHMEAWMALFDLYRVTGQQNKFETAALGFVERFNRSAPQWFSMPDIVRHLVTQEKGVGSVSAADWICPSAVGVQTVAELSAVLAKALMPWRLDWCDLKTIDAAAVEPLYRVFSDWSAQPVQLRFLGAAQLHRVLQNATPSSQKDTPRAWWQLRMEALRVTHRPDEFELAALDFCVTYEVSPPAWHSSQCDYKSLAREEGDTSAHTLIGDVYRDTMASSLSVQDGDTQIDRMSSQMDIIVLSVELSGQIHGDATAVLDQLEVKLMGADVLHISCAKLIRVDFSAAGTLLNWVSARQAENRSVQFSEVNRLVAAFFNVIGITEYARVVTRVD